jgi:hypothetical protein
MPRFTRTLSLLLTLSLFLASCLAPQTPPLPPVGEGTGVRATPPVPPDTSPVPPDTSHVTPDTLTPDTLTPPPQPSLESLGLTAEIQQMFTRQGWDIAWEYGRVGDSPQPARYLIRQRAWDEASQTFTSQLAHEIGYIDLEGNLHTKVTRLSATENPDGTWKDTSTTQDLILPLRSPLPLGEGLGVRVVETQNPAFEKTGILTLTYLDENGVLRTATFSQKEAAFVDFDLSTASENLFVWTSEPEVLQTEFPVTHIPWELLHDSSLPITARLIAEGFDRDFPEETKAALMGYILRFERADDGSKVCFLRPALRDQIPDPKNPQKTIKFEVTDEFVDDAVRWAARKDKNGNWERLFFTTIDPKGNKILFTYMQLLDINGNRLFLPLAIGVNVPDERMAHFIKMWNLLEDKNPGGNLNSSFFRIIIATEGDYLKDFPPNHILHSDIGEKSRDPLDSLLGMEGNDVMDGSLYPPGTAYFPSNIDYWMKQLSSKQTVQEIQPFSENLSYLLQTVVLVISP